MKFQIMLPTAKLLFACKSLSNTEQWYSITEREELAIQHGLKKFHHYCFVKEEHVITDYELIVAMISKYDAMLSNVYSTSCCLYIKSEYHFG